MKFEIFAEHLQKLESTASRLEMMYQLAELFPKLSKIEIAPASYLMQGRLVPRYKSLEFQLSAKMVMRALGRLVDVSPEKILKKYREMGDLGLVAEQVFSEEFVKKNKQNLGLLEVYEKLREIALHEGKGSQESKVLGLVGLLNQLDPLSTKFVVRMVIGKLRLGFSTMTIIDALSWAVAGDKSQRDLLERAYNRRADVGKLAKAWLTPASVKTATNEARMNALEKYKVQVGVPVVPALCQRLNTSKEIIDKLEEVLVEPKYDGLRVQIHIRREDKLKGGKVEVYAFTRNLENVTHMFPELIKISSFIECESCVLDAEAIGFNKKTGELVDFQTTITRRRKHSVKEKAADVPIRFFMFDLLFLNNKSLLEKKLHERKKLLKSLFKNSEYIHHAPFIRTSDPSKVQTFHEEKLEENLEGAVIKRVDSPYQSGRKGWHWVKIKEKEGTRGKLSDTLDCLVMGYYSGRGKRASFGLGAFLVGLKDSDGFYTVAKIGTGLSDDQLKELKDRCDKLAVKEKPTNYHVPKSLIPQVWIKPSLVVEIAADEITRSPLHSAKKALRFPRLVKFRLDKGPDEVTTVGELVGF